MASREPDSLVRGQSIVSATQRSGLCIATSTLSIWTQGEQLNHHAGTKKAHREHLCVLFYLFCYCRISSIDLTTEWVIGVHSTFLKSATIAIGM